MFLNDLLRLNQAVNVKSQHQRHLDLKHFGKDFAEVEENVYVFSRLENASSHYHLQRHCPWTQASVFLEKNGVFEGLIDENRLAFGFELVIG